MKKLKVLVTGASGFVGRNTVEHLCAAGHEVFACTDPVLDLRDAEAVKRVVGEFAPDCAVNCAAIVGTRKNAYDQAGTDVAAVNLRMFFNLQRALPPGARLLQLGSGAEYDCRAYKPKMAEEFFDTSVPADPYGFSKYVISKYAAQNNNVTVLRIFGVFGKYEDYTFKFISNAIVKNLLGLPIVINQNVIFDYLPVNDFGRVLERFIGHKPAHSHYNVTPTESIDLLTLAALVNRAGEKKSEVRVLNPGFNREYTGSNARFLQEFPGFKFTPYAQAVKELYAYYRENLGKLDTAAIKADPYLKNCKTTL
jgi:GDP-L-fucose synthase